MPKSLKIFKNLFLVKRARVKPIILEMTPADASDSVGDASLSDVIEEDGKTF